MPNLELSKQSDEVIKVVRVEAKKKSKNSEKEKNVLLNTILSEVFCYMCENVSLLGINFCYCYEITLSSFHFVSHP